MGGTAFRRILAGIVVAAIVLPLLLMLAVILLLPFLPGARVP